MNTKSSQSPSFHKSKTGTNDDIEGVLVARATIPKERSENVSSLSADDAGEKKEQSIYTSEYEAHSKNWLRLSTIDDRSNDNKDENF